MKAQYEIGMLVKSGNTMGVIAGVLFAKDYVKYMLEDDTFINEIDIEAAYVQVKNKQLAKTKDASKAPKVKKLAAIKKTDENSPSVDLVN